MVLEIRFAGNPAPKRSAFPAEMHPRERGRKNPNSPWAAKPIRVPIQISSKELLHKLEIKANYIHPGSDTNNASRLAFSLPVEDRNWKERRKVLFVPHATPKGDWFVNRVSWTEGEEAAISLHNLNEVELDTTLYLWCYITGDGTGDCKVELTIDQYSSEDDQSRSEKRVLRFTTNHSSECFNFSKEVHPEYEESYIVEHFQEEGAYHTEGPGYSMHPKQLVTSDVIRHLLHDYEGDRKLTLAYIGLDTGENFHTLLRVVNDPKIIDKVDSIVVLYHEQWDGSYMDLQFIREEVAGSSPIKIERRSMNEYMGSDDTDPYDVIISTYVALWGLSFEDSLDSAGYTKMVAKLTENPNTLFLSVDPNSPEDIARAAGGLEGIDIHSEHSNMGLIPVQNAAPIEGTMIVKWKVWARTTDYDIKEFRSKFDPDPERRLIRERTSVNVTGDDNITVVGSEHVSIPMGDSVRTITKTGDIPQGDHPPAPPTTIETEYIRPLEEEETDIPPAPAITGDNLFDRYTKLWFNNSSLIQCAGIVTDARKLYIPELLITTESGTVQTSLRQWEGGRLSRDFKPNESYLENKRFILLIGDAGWGKSVALRQIMHKRHRNFPHDLHVFIKANHLASALSETIAGASLRHIIYRTDGEKWDYEFNNYNDICNLTLESIQPSIIEHLSNDEILKAFATAAMKSVGHLESYISPEEFLQLLKGRFIHLYIDAIDEIRYEEQIQLVQDALEVLYRGISGPPELEHAEDEGVDLTGEYFEEFKQSQEELEAEFSEDWDDLARMMARGEVGVEDIENFFGDHDMDVNDFIDDPYDLDLGQNDISLDVIDEEEAMEHFVQLSLEVRYSGFSRAECLIDMEYLFIATRPTHKDDISSPSESVVQYELLIDESSFGKAIWKEVPNRLIRAWHVSSNPLLPLASEVIRKRTKVIKHPLRVGWLCRFMKEGMTEEDIFPSDDPTSDAFEFEQLIIRRASILSLKQRSSSLDYDDETLQDSILEVLYCIAAMTHTLTHRETPVNMIRYGQRDSTPPRDANKEEIVEFLKNIKKTGFLHKDINSLDEEQYVRMFLEHMSILYLTGANDLEWTHAGLKDIGTANFYASANFEKLFESIPRNLSIRMRKERSEIISERKMLRACPDVVTYYLKLVADNNLSQMVRYFLDNMGERIGSTHQLTYLFKMITGKTNDAFFEFDENMDYIIKKKQMFGRKKKILIKKWRRALDALTPKKRSLLGVLESDITPKDLRELRDLWLRSIEDPFIAEESDDIVSLLTAGGLIHLFDGIDLPAHHPFNTSREKIPVIYLEQMSVNRFERMDSGSRGHVVNLAGSRQGYREFWLGDPMVPTTSSRTAFVQLVAKIITENVSDTLVFHQSFNVLLREVFPDLEYEFAVRCVGDRIMHPSYHSFDVNQPRFFMKSMAQLCNGYDPRSKTKKVSLLKIQTLIKIRLSTNQSRTPSWGRSESSFGRGGRGITHIPIETYEWFKQQDDDTRNDISHFLAEVQRLEKKPNPDDPDGEPVWHRPESTSMKGMIHLTEITKDIDPSS